MKQGGFSLLEILISSFILALGLLGLAGMQSTAIKSAVEVHQRSLANSLLQDISERMQLNKVWLHSTNNNYSIDSLADANLVRPDCVNATGGFTNCTGLQIKNNDLFEWKNKFAGGDVTNAEGFNAGLIGADACIEADNSGLSTIVISWYSTVKSVDAAQSEANDSIYFKCGDASNYRRQISMKTYISKT